MTRVSVTVVVALVVGLLAPPARADREDRAKQLYSDGEKAYQANDYQLAYEDFKQAYLLSQEPALLYDIASALQGLGRPHDAAEALRTYLKQVPNDPDRPKIEKRIASLEDSQRLLDSEKKPAPPPEPLPTMPKSLMPDATPAVPPGALTTTEEEREARSKRRRNIAIVATVLSVVVAGAAVGLGIAFAPHSVEPPTKSDLGPVTGTP